MSYLQSHDIICSVETWTSTDIYITPLCSLFEFFNLEKPIILGYVYKPCDGSTFYIQRDESNGVVELDALSCDNVYPQNITYS